MEAINDKQVAICGNVGCLLGLGFFLYHTDCESNIVGQIAEGTFLTIGAVGLGSIIGEGLKTPMGKFIGLTAIVVGGAVMIKKAYKNYSKV